MVSCNSSCWGIPVFVLRLFNHARRSSLSYALSASSCFDGLSGSSSGMATWMSEVLLGVNRKAIGRPCRSMTAWIFVVCHPSSCQWLRCLPLFSARRAVRLDDRRVDVVLVMRADDGCQITEYFFPQTFHRPAMIPVVNSRAWAVLPLAVLPPATRCTYGSKIGHGRSSSQNRLPD